MLNKEKLADKINVDDDYEIIITIQSAKNNCHSSYLLSQAEINNGLVPEIILFLTERLTQYIKEKGNAFSEGEESSHQKRVLN